MGSYVSGIAVPSITIPGLPASVDGTWNGGVNPSSPWTMVRQRFEQSLATADDMLNRLVGGGGYDGYLPMLENIIEEFPTDTIEDITYRSVTIGNDVGTAVAAPPVMSGTIITDFGSFNTSAPVQSAITSIDLSSLFDADLPEDIMAAISWMDAAHDTSLYTPLFNRLIADLQTGATGLTAEVEQAIFDRAQARQNVEEDKIQSEIEEYFANSGFDLPPGAMAARLQEHANGRAMRTLDLNEKIQIDQAELAQKNSQFVINAARELEAVLRDYTSKANDRSLDYSKAVAANAIARYAEGIKAFIAQLEANRNAVQIQVENLRAVIEANKGLIAAYAAEAEVFKISVDAKARTNEAITDVYKTEIAGYDSQTKAISENQKNLVAAYELRMKDARNDLDAAIASAEAEVRGYVGEYSLREKVAESMANIAMQAMASAYGAVNSSAGLSYNGSESLSESWGHSESRSDNYSHSEGVSATVSVGIDNKLNENHSFDE